MNIIYHRVSSPEKNVVSNGLGAAKSLVFVLIPSPKEKKKKRKERKRTIRENPLHVSLLKSKSLGNTLFSYSSQRQQSIRLASLVPVSLTADAHTLLQTREHPGIYDT